MKRVLASLALALTAFAAVAQDRGPVILSDRGSEEGPTPGPDPSGVYTGTVTFTLGDTQTLTQTWRFALKAQPCPTCGAGRYIISETDYSLARFSKGVERGSIWGVVEPDGTAYLVLRGVNCPYLTLGYDGTSFYQSGALGPTPGTAIKIANGVMTGRISGYDCFGERLVADILLRRDTSATPKTCPYLARIYDGDFDDSCGGISTAPTSLEQAGCAISVHAPAGHASYSILLTTPTTGTLAVNYSDGCDGTADGTVEIEGGVISGTFSGTSAGGTDCCPPGPVSGTFRLTPQ